MSEALRAIEPLSIPDLQFRPTAEIGAMPHFEMARPQDLFVEASYQRDLSKRSIALIRTIVANWDWRRFKPPICSALDDGRRAVIDGQHTAIAAACHPAIEQIPIFLTETGTIADRANAFVGHNRDHVAITQLQMHRAAVAAGDEVAVAVDDACRLAGVTLLAVNRPRGEWKPGETIAIKGIYRAVQEKGRAGASRVLKILVRARCMPVGAVLLGAVFDLLYAAEWRWKDDDALADVIAAKSTDDWLRWAQDHRDGQTSTRTLAIEWYRRLSGGGASLADVGGRLPTQGKRDAPR